MAQHWARILKIRTFLILVKTLKTLSTKHILHKSTSTVAGIHSKPHSKYIFCKEFFWSHRPSTPFEQNVVLCFVLSGTWHVAGMEITGGHHYGGETFQSNFSLFSWKYSEKSLLHSDDYPLFSAPVVVMNNTYLYFSTFLQLFLFTRIVNIINMVALFMSFIIS